MLTKPRLLTPGPTPLPERVRLAMAHDMIHHRKPEFKAVMARVQEGLGELFGTSQPVLPLASSGTGAMTAAVYNLFSAGEKVLVVEAGKFAERWTAIATMHGLEVKRLEVTWGDAVTASMLQEALDADPTITGVFVQQSETSTGVQHPIKELAAVTRKRSVLLVVDGISGVSLSPCPMDAWGIDCLLTGSQKGLMLPPGLALIALSARAWEKTEQVKPTNFYFNLCKERENAKKCQTHFTTPVSLIVGLDESLKMFKEAGLETVYRKQWALTQMARTGVTALGLTLFAPTHFAWGVTSVLLPEGVKASELLAIAAQKYGVIMAAGQDHLKDKMVRIGHMGWLDYGDLAAGLHALALAYGQCGGFSGCRDYLEQALTAYWHHLEQGYPGTFAD